MLQIAVQGAADPVGDGQRGVSADAPLEIQAVLDQVCRRTLFTFHKGSQDCILLFPLESIAEVDVVPLFHLAKAGVDDIDVRLLAYAGLRMIGGAEVVFILGYNMQRKAPPSRVDNIVENEI